MEVTFAHVALDAVNVSVTLLFDKSVAEASYVEVRDAGFEKQITQPLEEVQANELPFVTPASGVVSLFLQIDWFGPALTV